MSKSEDRVSWFEIPVTDLEQSAALYGKTLGIEMKREVLFGRVVQPTTDITRSGRSH
ncbi:MAG TPA: hypothetical protein VHU18_03670 [Rhizomicrobium sp.]|jgi:predicted enzyme related to lactoylglutathione lyase|nr:hypothetical protein [Rhizomicrobium sp.]